MRGELNDGWCSCGEAFDATATPAAHHLYDTIEDVTPETRSVSEYPIRNNRRLRAYLVYWITSTPIPHLGTDYLVYAQARKKRAE